MTGTLAKPKWVLGLLVAAFAVPYTVCNQELRSAVAKALAGSEPAAGEPSPAAAAAAGQPAASAVPLSPQAPTCDLASALSFDVTPQWVTGAWPQVTTVPDTRLSGLRVPLVTGVMPDDVVGTLTYYFDTQQRLQRITFAGNTADPRRFVSLITSQYRLTPQATLDAGLYQSKWNGRVISSLHVRQAPLAAAGARANYDLALDLHRADLAAGTAGAPRRLFGF